jgi:hypothetical protein
MTRGTKIVKIIGQIEENWKINGHLRVNLYKSETKDRIGEDTELRGSQLSLTEVKLHEFES